MIRLTIVPLIADLPLVEESPWCRERDDDSSGKSRETCRLLFLRTQSTRAEGVCGMDLGRGGGGGGRRAPAQKLASKTPPVEISHRTVPPLSGPTPGSFRLKRQTMTLPRSPFRLPVTRSARPDSTYLPLKVSPSGKVVHSLPLPPNRLDSYDRTAGTGSWPGTIRRPLIGAEAHPTITASTSVVAAKRLALVRRIMNNLRGLLYTKPFPSCAAPRVHAESAGQGGAR